MKSEQILQAKIIEVIANILSFRGKIESSPNEEFRYAEILRRHYPSWQAIAEECSQATINIWKKDDLVVASGADALKLAIATERCFEIFKPTEEKSNLVTSLPWETAKEYAMRSKCYFRIREWDEHKNDGYDWSDVLCQVVKVPLPESSSF